MRKCAKETTKQECEKKEKKVRARAETTRDAVETPATVEPAGTPAAEPEIETTTVAPVGAEPPTVEAPAEVPAPVESAPAPASDTAPVAEAASIDAASAAEVPAEVPATAEKKEVPAVELESMRRSVETAKAALEAAEADAKVLLENARVIVNVARDDYRKALAPYRDACRKAGRPCGFHGGRAKYVSQRVSFIVEKVAGGVRVMIRGRPETEETIPLDALKDSVSRASYAYTDRWLGPKETIGNKGGGLGNRVRSALK